MSDSLSPRKRELGLVVLVILKAQHLPDPHHFSKQDPFCVAQLGEEPPVQTRVDRGGGQHPLWDEEFRLKLYEVEGEPQILNLKVMRQERPDDAELIGEGNVLIDGTWKEFDEWIELKKDGKYAGEVYVEITYYEAQRRRPSNEIQRRPSKLDPATRANRIPSTLQPGGVAASLSNLSIRESRESKILPAVPEPTTEQRTGSSSSLWPFPGEPETPGLPQSLTPGRPAPRSDVHQVPQHYAHQAVPLPFPGEQASQQEPSHPGSFARPPFSNTTSSEAANAMQQYHGPTGSTPTPYLSASPHQYILSPLEQPGIRPPSSYPYTNSPSHPAHQSYSIPRTHLSPCPSPSLAPKLASYPQPSPSPTPLDALPDHRRPPIPPRPSSASSEIRIPGAYDPAPSPHPSPPAIPPKPASPAPSLPRRTSHSPTPSLPDRFHSTRPLPTNPAGDSRPAPSPSLSDKRAEASRDHEQVTVPPPPPPAYVADESTRDAARRHAEERERRRAENEERERRRAEDEERARLERARVADERKLARIKAAQDQLAARIKQEQDDARLAAEADERERQAERDRREREQAANEAFIRQLQAEEEDEARRRRAEAERRDEELARRLRDEDEAERRRREREDEEFVQRMRDDERRLEDAERARRLVEDERLARTLAEREQHGERLRTTHP
ncbi:hypothetical protein JCM10212_001607 [Sporobolomyces blumeae]